MVDVERHGAEDVVVHGVVFRAGDLRHQTLVRLDALVVHFEELVELGHQPVEQVVVARRFGIPEGSQPGADIGVGGQRALPGGVHVAPVGVARADEEIDDPFADRFGVFPVGEADQIVIFDFGRRVGLGFGLYARSGGRFLAACRQAQSGRGESEKDGFQNLVHDRDRFTVSGSVCKVSRRRRAHRRTTAWRPVRGGRRSDGGGSDTSRSCFWRRCLRRRCGDCLSR